MASKRHKAQIHQIDFNFGQNLLLILELLAIFEKSKQIWLRDFPGELCQKLARGWQPIRDLESENFTIFHFLTISLAVRDFWASFVTGSVDSTFREN